MERLGKKRGFVRYWMRKAEDPLFHPGVLGGPNHCVFTQDGQMIAEAMLWAEVKRECQLPCRIYAEILTDRGLPVDAR